jgi:uncharacterized OB-fold protein
MPRFAVRRDGATAEFFDGTARGEFLLVQDTRTGGVLAPQFDATVDQERYLRVQAAGTGTVVSWAVVHQREADGSTSRIPVAVVELDEGPWWWTSITGADPDEELLGRRVRVAFETVGDGEAIPYFTVIEAADPDRGSRDRSGY